MGRNSRKRRERRTQQPLTPHPPPPRPPPDRWTAQYQTADVLSAMGPLLLATWQQPPEHRDALHAAGGAIPPAVGGHMLVDTGASVTCISQGVAHQLGLLQTGVQRVHGAGGIHENPVFAGEMTVSISDGRGTASFTITMGVAAVPGLDNAVAGLNPNIRIVGLLGRDLLRHMRMTYDGTRGRVDYLLDWASLRAAGSRSQ